MVELCHAIAVAEADGPQAGIVLLDVIAAGETIAVSHLIHATRADLLRRLGRTGEAVAAYESAIAAVANNAERDYLARRRDQLIDRDT
jgi:RNA polymerase sigma-70 factor (ECF subfamily)